ncbi:carboxymuconolactone decarboxylase [Glonium stellatum]|uniref:Carboxymuconolactone decarboxylase n=1 Tax=Glonium stellatum TaxID=574774 RepID=A0A8E2FCK0_9PEZI|nr:carboxymuconolactone decarboxylase [Glonium stellatum]
MPPLSHLPAIITPSLLASIRGNAQLPKHSWYFIVGVTLSVINRPDEIPKVFNFVIEHGVGPTENTKPARAEQLQIARKLREGLIKSAAIAGMPKTINGLFALKAATPSELLDEPMGYSPSARRVEVYDMPSSQILCRGQKFFEKVYGKVSKRVMGQMDRSGTEDLGVVARLMYGHLLSNTKILTPAETSFVLLAGLIPQDVNPQLKGHLKGAISNGATAEEVRAVRDVVIRICEASGMVKLGEDAPHAWGWREDVAGV